MAGRPAKKKATEFGERLAALRKAAGLSQADIASKLGIPQRRFSYYEREGRFLPSNLIRPLAKLLEVPVSELLEGEAQTTSKRGPKSKLERLFEKAQKLPRSKQELITKLLREIIGN